MDTRHRLDLLEILTSQDGNFNEEVGAYVTAYALSEFEIQYELEYTDRDNDDEVVEVVRMTVRIDDE